VNYALQDMTKEAFIKEVTDGILPPPQYFPKNAMLNKSGYTTVNDAVEKGNQALSLEEFKKQVEAGALVLDTRTARDFAKGFVPRSLYIGINGGFAVWLGTLVHDLNQAIVLIADPGTESEVALRAARVGYDNIAGYLDGGFATWKDSGEIIDKVTYIDSNEFAERRLERTVLDVRKPTEHDAERVEDAVNHPLDFIRSNVHELDKGKEYFVHCKGGYRSMIASSILKSNGIHNIVEIEGGMDAIVNSGVPITAYVCPSTL
jgi:rhodanese-related sulfurtransferase